MKLFTFIAVLIFISTACNKSSDSITVNVPSQYPETPVYTYPLNEAVDLPHSFVLTWNASKDPQGDPVVYEVNVSTSSFMNGDIYLVKNIPEPNALIYVGSATIYYWQVTAKDNHNNISIGPIWKFTSTSKK